MQGRASRPAAPLHTPWSPSGCRPQKRGLPRCSRRSAAPCRRRRIPRRSKGQPQACARFSAAARRLLSPCPQALRRGHFPVNRRRRCMRCVPLFPRLRGAGSFCLPLRHGCFAPCFSAARGLRPFPRRLQKTQLCRAVPSAGVFLPAPLIKGTEKPVPRPRMPRRRQPVPAGHCAPLSFVQGQRGGAASAHTVRHTLYHAPCAAQRRGRAWRRELQRCALFFAQGWRGAKAFVHMHARDTGRLPCALPPRGAFCCFAPRHMLRFFG